MKPEILFGFHPVWEAFRAGRRRVFEVYVAKDEPRRRVAPLLALAAERGAVVETKSVAELKRLAGSDYHQGICAKAEPYPLADIDELIQQAGDAAFLLMADSIVDAHNLGAIIRTAVCAGAAGVILPKDRSAYPTPGVSRASAGAMEHIHLAVVNNLVHAINLLKERGYWVIGLDGAAADSVFDAVFPARTALVVGGEEKGIRPLVKKNCDLRLAIPQSGPIGSLNASVAAAVAMYAVVRGKGQK